MRMFPIMIRSQAWGKDSDVERARARGVPYVVVCLPWEMIEPHEKQALKNHSQTLERLAQRGGLCASEAVAVLEGKGWHEIDSNSARANEKLARLIAEWVDRELYPSPEQREQSSAIPT